VFSADNLVKLPDDPEALKAMVLSLLQEHDREKQHAEAQQQRAEAQAQRAEANFVRGLSTQVVKSLNR
jgi:hypothetical protein